VPNFSVTRDRLGNKSKSVIEELRLSKFEDVFVWLGEIKGPVKVGVGVMLYGLAKDGRTGCDTARESIEVRSDCRDYFLAREVAIKTGLLKTRPGGDVYVRTREAGLAFARAMDSRVPGQTP